MKAQQKKSTINSVNQGDFVFHSIYQEWFEVAFVSHKDKETTLFLEKGNGELFSVLMKYIEDVTSEMPELE